MDLGHLGGEGGLMNMVKSPESSVQPADLGFEVCLVARQLFNLEEKFLFDGLLAPSGGQQHVGSWEDQQYDEVPSHTVRTSWTSWRGRAQYGWSAMPCTKWDFKVRESTAVTAAIKHCPMVFSAISVGNESHSSGESGL